MKQVFLNRVLVYNTVADVYYHPQNGTTDSIRSTGSATEAVEYFIAPTAGNMRNLYIHLDTAPVGATSYVMTLRVNGADTAVVATVAGAAVSADSGGNNVNVAAGDLITIHKTHTGSPTNNVEGNMAIEFNSTTDGYSSLTGGMPDFSGAGFRTPGLWDGNTTHVYNEMVMPHDCTIRAIYMNCAVAPGSGKSRTLTFSRVGGGFSQAIAVSDTNTLNSVTGLSGAFSQGERMTVALAVSGGPAASDVRYTLLVESVNGWSIMPVRGARFGQIDGHTPQTGNTHGNANDSNSSDTTYVGPTELELKNFFFRGNATINAADSKDFTLIKNGVDTVLAITGLTNVDNGSNTTDRITFSQGDTMVIRHDHTGTGTSSTLDGVLVFTQIVGGQSPSRMPLLFAG